MNLCRSTLREIRHEGFSSAALRALADGRRLPFRLDFTRRDLALDSVSPKAGNTLSVSGVQDKVGLALVKGRLVIAERSSQYILKPIPSLPSLPFLDDIPANEHVTMQIAAQVCGIAAAANACVLMADGEPAYLTRRFDYRGGEKILQEDFCQLLGVTEETNGLNYKYDGSYEGAARVIRRFCPSYRVETMKFFKRVVFNYLFSNGDAHLKNFSLYPGVDGDYVLTPAYDLLDTSMLFPSESSLALRIFEDEDFYTPAYEKLGFYSRADFLELGDRIGLPRKASEGVLAGFSAISEDVESLVRKCFMSEPAKREYLARFFDRKHALETCL